MDIIIPCAGLSSRFPNLKPKYLLEDSNGKLMIENVIGNMHKNNNVYISLLKEHIDKYNAYEIVKNKFGDFIQIVVIDYLTKGPAETVFLTLEKTKNDGSFLVRDCDSFFDSSCNDGNFVFTSKLSNNKLIKNPEQLGYVVKNEDNVISSVVEKKVVSDDFCVGGYQFSKKKNFINNFKTIVDNHKEIFMSHVVSSMIANQEIFHTCEVTNYVNVGTLDNWNTFILG
jgi:bifunctional N-acetylglucosamine-1-phosphate-uridyltransferase/glucosamine-1-phosphate-acetyltransferase GlmU-like protein